jgi:hypothetical protein
MATISDPETNSMLLGRYRVDAMLGEGSFGTVVLAFDTRLKRTVAIKTLKRAVAAADIEQFQAIEERFAREAEAGSRMGIHTNLVTVHDLVIEPDRTQYLILEYVRGGTLAERLAQGPLSRGDALRIAADVSRGLQAAHDVGIVHRDVKPANIFIGPNGRAQLGDFGIAQIDDVSGRTHSVIQHPGTPLYMSPEQAQTTGYVRPASDQYSLGLVLFEMLTGTAYKRIGERAAMDLLADQPLSLASLIEDMIATDPDDRLPSCERVARQIGVITRSLGMTETELAFDAPDNERGQATVRPPGVANGPGLASAGSARPLASAGGTSVYSVTESERRVGAGSGLGSAPSTDTATGGGIPRGTARLNAMPVPPVSVGVAPTFADSRRLRRGPLVVGIALLFLMLLGGGMVWAMRGSGSTPHVTQTPQQPAATTLAAASNATPTIALTATVTPTVVPSATVVPTIVPTVTAVPPTVAPTPLPPTVPPAPAASRIAVFSVGTTNANLTTVNGDDVVTMFTAGQEVYGFINFGGAQVNKDVLEVTLVANGTPQPPQSFTLQKSDGFQVFPLGKLGAGDYRLEVRYAGKVAQNADFHVAPPPAPRPQPTAVLRTNPTYPPSSATPVQPTATATRPTGTTTYPTSTAAATTAPKPTATAVVLPTPTPKP